MKYQIRKMLLTLPTLPFKIEAYLKPQESKGSPSPERKHLLGEAFLSRCHGPVS